MGYRVGIDLVSVRTIEEAMDEHAERYLERVYTARELDDCRGPHGIDPQRLAARYAAKEAAIKVLRPADDPVPWGDIEIRREPGGWTEITLAGHAQRLAEAGGLGSLSVSLTHEQGLASAVVIAEVARSGR